MGTAILVEISYGGIRDLIADSPSGFTTVKLGEKIIFTWSAKINLETVWPIILKYLVEHEKIGGGSFVDGKETELDDQRAEIHFIVFKENKTGSLPK